MATTNPSSGWPDSTNTGVPAGVTLTPSGDLVITQAGAVISGLDIKGSVIIKAANVTLENCKITSGAWFVVDIKGVSGTVIQNCEINGVGSTSGSVGINGQGTFIGNNIYNVENGINLTGSAVIKDNYIHDLNASGSPHYDGIQIDGGVSNVTISDNTVIAPTGGVSAIMIDNYWGPISNISVSNNLLAGGGFTVYSADAFSGGPVTGVSFTNNHMKSGQYGYTSFYTTNPVYTGNVNDGATLVATLNTTANTGSGGTAPPPAAGAPVIGSWSSDTGVAGDGITSDNTLALKGTAAANSTIKIYDGSTQIGTTTANSTGSWDYITSVLTNAKHVLTATATNTSGQTSAKSGAVTLTVDTVAPTTPALSSNSIVNANQVKLSGTAEANSKVTIYDGTSLVGTGTTDSTGAWSVTTSALSTGTHALTVKAADVAGNVSAASQSINSVIGTASPTPPPTSGTPIESAGATSLVQSGDNYHLNSHSGSGPTLKAYGAAVDEGNFGAWTPIGVEQTATGYQVAWKLTGQDQYTIWNTDTNGNYVSNTSLMSGSQLKSFEASFQQDLNGDGTTGGLTTNAIEAIGSTSLVQVGENYNLSSGGGSGPTLKANGTAVDEGQYGGWTPIGVEQTATGYQVAWKLTSQDQYTIWNTDTNGNYVSNTSLMSGSQLKSFEASFHQDLNGDGAIGSSAGAPLSSVALTTMSKNWSDIVTIKGVADANSQIKLFDGNTSLGTVNTAADGTWSFKTSSAVSDTVHTYTAQQIDSTGQVVGTSGSAILGSTGSNTLKGSSGNDIFVGGGQSDTFVFAANFGRDVIRDFTASGSAQDTIQFSKTVFDSFAGVLSHASQDGQDVIISTGSDTLTLKNTKLSALNSNDFHFA